MFRRKRQDQSGFTLLEVLIALVLSALLLGVLTAGMRAVVDEWQDSNNPFEDELDLSLIYLQLEQALLGASPHSYVDEDTLEAYVYFNGTRETLSWVSTVSLQARQQLTAWRLSGEDRDGIYLKTVPAFADNPDERLEAATAALILPEHELTLSYLMLDDLGRPEWLEEWDGIEYQSLPMAIRLEFSNDETAIGKPIEYIVPILNRLHETIEAVDPS